MLFRSRMAHPFEHISMDLIVKLPPSQGYDSILTITDHDCSKAAIFLPCNETIDGPGVAELYVQHVFPHYGVPKKIISDRDTRFVSNFPKELCKILDIKQNISTAYHPQTDGQSEQTNQWLEQFLRIYVNHQQNNWASYLPVAQYAHNAWLNSTTKQEPFKLILGYIPRAHQLPRSDQMPSLNDRIDTIKKA